jgi:hypothetical protein
MKKVSLTPSFMLALALIGIAVAFYDSYAIYNRQPLWCPPPIDGCNIVADSPYARIFGLPLGYFGLVYYVYMFGLVALLALDPFSRGLRLGTLLYAAVGISLDWLYVYPVHLHPRFLHLLSDLRRRDDPIFHRRALAFRHDGERQHRVRRRYFFVRGKKTSSLRKAEWRA